MSIFSIRENDTEKTVSRRRGERRICRKNESHLFYGKIRWSLSVEVFFFSLSWFLIIRCKVVV